jgi:hypothetical protein
MGQPDRRREVAPFWYVSTPLDARFYTISDARFFVGTVALFNSLRLMGHENELVVLDRGLTEAQRRVLHGHCTLVTIPDNNADPYLVKPFPARVGASGVAVLLDSDMVVTSSLDSVLETAASGRICVFPDHPVDIGRWFAEWEALFDLAAPLRRGPYMNAGFTAVSVENWPQFFVRWWDACRRVAERRESLVDSEPLAQLDQDALNAILLSEVKDEDVERLPSYEWDLRRVSVDDERTLRCTGPDGRTQPLLHAWMRPKVWQSRERVHANAYERLAPRLLLDSDVEIRLDSADVPMWLHPGWRGRVSLHALSAYNELPVLARRVPRIPRRLAREVRAGVRSHRRGSSVPPE